MFRNMLLKKYRSSVISLSLSDQDKVMVKFKRYKDGSMIDFCSVCKFYEEVKNKCKYNANILCEKLDTNHYSYIPC